MLLCNAVYHIDYVSFCVFCTTDASFFYCVWLFHDALIFIGTLWPVTSTLSQDLMIMLFGFMLLCSFVFFLVYVSLQHRVFVFLFITQYWRTLFCCCVWLSHERVMYLNRICLMRNEESTLWIYISSYIEFHCWISNTQLPPLATKCAG